MSDLNFSRCKLPPFEHQKIGVQALINHPFFLLADEMGAGKTKQVIDAAQFLYCQQVIDRVVVIAPASVRAVWCDPELGELVKHLWDGLPVLVTEFHTKTKQWMTAPNDPRLKWVITNYEFIRNSHLGTLLNIVGPKTLLVLDESTSIKNPRAAQTKACIRLRQLCGRVVLLNGTPIANHPGDMFAQGAIMYPHILSCKSYFMFRARYAVMGGYQQKVIIGWQNLDDLQQRFKPYVLRRLKKDCLDLPEALAPVTLTVPLTKSTWDVYKAMRDHMVAWLTKDSVTIAQQAVVKSLRLAQITSGFVGGVEHDDHNGFTDSDPPVLLPAVPTEISREKLDFLLSWHRERLEEDPDLKLLVWVRFRSELMRLMSQFENGNGSSTLRIGSIYGGQKKADRETALRLLDPRTAPSNPVLLAGTYGTGSLGINLSACHTVVNLSYDFSYWKFLQSAARVDRPGQTHAVGPEGQKTIDHQIVKARRAKEDIAQWTTSAWVRALTEE